MKLTTCPSRPSMKNMYAFVLSDSSMVSKCRVNLIMVILSIVLCSLMGRYHVLEKRVASVLAQKLRGNRFLECVDICTTSGESCD